MESINLAKEFGIKLIFTGREKEREREIRMQFFFFWSSHRTLFMYWPNFTHGSYDSINTKYKFIIHDKMLNLVNAYFRLLFV